MDIAALYLKERAIMTFATYAIVVISCTLLGYMLGVSDGKVEGRIESFKGKR